MAGKIVDSDKSISLSTSNEYMKERSQSPKKRWCKNMVREKEFLTLVVFQTK